MTAILNTDLLIDTLIKELGAGVYFIIITSENGAVLNHHISQEFNKSALGLNISQMYELAEEITAEVGVHSPDFNLIHCSNFYYNEPQIEYAQKLSRYLPNGFNKLFFLQ